MLRRYASRTITNGHHSLSAVDHWSGSDAQHQCSISMVIATHCQVGPQHQVRPSSSSDLKANVSRIKLNMGPHMAQVKRVSDSGPCTVQISQISSSLRHLLKSYIQAPFDSACRSCFFPFLKVIYSPSLPCHCFVKILI